jgi:outer membrane protein OmpA-like peptidoglycan-associated protein
LQTTRARRTGRPPGHALLALGAAVALAVGCESMSVREPGTATGAAIGAVGAVAGNLWSKHLEDKRRAVERASAGTGIDVVRTEDDRLKVNVPSDFSFVAGRADIKPAMRPVLDELGRNLDPKVAVTVVGHTDSSGNAALNEPLSRERALSVRDYLARQGVTSRRLSVDGMGARAPVAPNSSDAGRAANRRVEIFLVDRAS